jgi:hypothetical protein
MKLVIKDSADVTIRTIDNVLGVNDPSAVATDQWITYSGTPTYLSATTFSVAGDQTGTFQVNRRLKSVNAGGTIYSTVTASSFGAGITTATVTNDSGTLDVGLSQIYYGIVSATNSSLTFVPILSGTAVASTSGTSIDFTSIPAWVKRITISLAGVSTSGTSNPIFQIGDSGGVETSGYLGGGSGAANAAVWSINNYTNGFGIFSASAAAVLHGSLVLTLVNSATNTWAAHGQFASSAAAEMFVIAGTKPLSATLDRVRLTTAGGADTFDAGVVNINYE